ncbi:MAG: hypothetical protein FWF85_00780 [Clostridiales bacterium]|jgi:hypothetical protein|nr:hypothetical protein [Clostridiales bacterium]
MKKLNDIEKEINAIRVSLYEEIKGMSPSEMTAYMKAQVTPIEKKYGIYPVKALKVSEHREKYYDA